REHGRWLLAPEGPGEPTRRYRSGSLVLETEWDTPDGRIRVIDAMPPRGEAPTIVRVVEGLAGRGRIRPELLARFGYGRIVPALRRLDDAFVVTAGPDAIELRTPVPTVAENTATVSSVEVRAGQRVPFTLRWFPSHTQRPPHVDPEEEL